MLGALVAGPATGATPAPKASHAPVAVPTPHLPTDKLHTEFVVEVNAKGQVVRVEKAKGCKNLTFNAQTYGNVLQMWIRHPDGSAQTGVYRVVYDYDPHTKKVHRTFALLKTGGTWANAEGAANDMMRKAEEETRAAQQRQEQQNKNLPSLDKIVAPSPSTKP